MSFRLTDVIDSIKSDFKEADVSIARNQGWIGAREVTVGKNVCLVKDVINELQHRIHVANAKDDCTDLKQLKTALLRFSAHEEKNRDFIAKIFHFFSGRSKAVTAAVRSADEKITHHNILKKLEEGSSLTVQQYSRLQITLVKKEVVFEDKEQIIFQIKNPFRAYISWNGRSGNNGIYKVVFLDKKADGSDFTVNDFFKEKP